MFRLSFNKLRRYFLLNPTIHFILLGGGGGGSSMSAESASDSSDSDSNSDSDSESSSKMEGSDNEDIQEAEYFGKMLDKIEELEAELVVANSDDDAEWINERIAELKVFVEENFEGLDNLLKKRKKRKAGNEEEEDAMDDKSTDDEDGPKTKRGKKGGAK